MRTYQIIRELDLSFTHPIPSGRCWIIHTPTGREVVSRSSNQRVYWPDAASAGCAAIHFSENCLDAQFVLQS